MQESQYNQAQTVAQLTTQALEVRRVGETPFITLPEESRVEGLEHFLPRPTRRCGIVNVQDQAGFLALFKRYRNEQETVIYADREEAIFKAVFNDHSNDSTGWRDHVCRYACPKSNEWQVWMGNDGVKMSQEQFAHFIEQNLVDIVEPVSAEMLEISRSLIAKKSASFSSAIRLSDGSHQFSYDEDIKGSTKSGNLAVPETFKIGIPVFLNGTGYAIEARLRYRIKEQSLEMWYELIRPHDVFEDAFNAIHAEISKETGMELIAAEC